MKNIRQIALTSYYPYGKNKDKIIAKRIFDVDEAIAKHDSALLDKVVEKLKAEVNICKNCMIVDCNTEYFKHMCEKADKGFIVAEVEEIVDTVIEEMKKDTHTAM